MFFRGPVPASLDPNIMDGWEDETYRILPITC